MRKWLICLLLLFSIDAYAFDLLAYNDEPFTRQLSSQQKKFVYDHWYRGTFPTPLDSLNYHVRKHGQGRSRMRYTKDALHFFHKNKHLGRKRMLLDGTPGMKITTRRAGGIFTQKGKIVTFWYDNEH